MPYTVDQRVDTYLSALPEWQQAICQAVRDLVHAADDEVVETIKRAIQRAGGWRKLKRVQAES